MMWLTLVCILASVAHAAVGWCGQVECPIKPKCEAAEIEMVIAIDASCSMSQSDWTNQRTFATEFVKAVEQQFAVSSFAGVVFGTQANAGIPVDYTSRIFSNLGSTSAQFISNYPPVGGSGSTDCGGTPTDEAIFRMNQVFNTPRTGGRIRMGILITDGVPTFCYTGENTCIGNNAVGTDPVLHGFRKVPIACQAAIAQRNTYSTTEGLFLSVGVGSALSSTVGWSGGSNTCQDKDDKDCDQALDGSCAGQDCGDCGFYCGGAVVTETGQSFLTRLASHPQLSVSPTNFNALVADLQTILDKLCFYITDIPTRDELSGYKHCVSTGQTLQIQGGNFFDMGNAKCRFKAYGADNFTYSTATIQSFSSATCAVPTLAYPDGTYFEVEFSRDGVYYTTNQLALMVRGNCGSPAPTKSPVVFNRKTVAPTSTGAGWCGTSECGARPKCDGAALDLVLVIDQSSSIASGDWDTQTAFVEEMILASNRTLVDYRVALVYFGKLLDITTGGNGFNTPAAELIAQMSYDFPSVAEKGRAHEKAGGYTPTDEGLKLAREHLAATKRADVPQTLVLLTDGEPTTCLTEGLQQDGKPLCLNGYRGTVCSGATGCSTDATDYTNSLVNSEKAARKQADLLKADGVLMVAVAVNINSAEGRANIKTFASDPKDYFGIVDATFATLVAETLPRILNTLCYYITKVPTMNEPKEYASCVSTNQTIHVEGENLFPMGASKCRFSQRGISNAPYYYSDAQMAYASSGGICRTGMTSTSSESTTTGQGVNQAFDNGDDTSWKSFGADTTPWAQMKFYAGTTISGYSLTSAATDPTMDPKSWTLYGDGVVLSEVTGHTFANRFEKVDFTIAVPGAYTEYNLSVTEINGAGEVQIANIALECDGVEMPTSAFCVVPIMPENKPTIYVLDVSREGTYWTKNEQPMQVRDDCGTARPTIAPPINTGTTDTPGVNSATVVAPAVALLALLFN